MTALELLAPARNADIGIAAIRSGADAVYIGGPSYGARKAAGNSIEDILRLCAEAAKYRVRIFITVNTLCENDQERTEVVRMMASLKDKGISAFIIQDCTLLPLLQEKGPWKEEFHASTQCAIRTPERALELCKLGFHRLILERQLSLETIRAIRKAVPAEVDLEFFVHGALCVCYSGDCYLSEYLTGRSANRGECAQPCRNMFDLVDGSGRTLLKNKPILSLKDLSLIGRLSELAAAGVISFKIEGRLKNESYVKNVVRSYSDALDALTAANPDTYVRSSLGKVSGGFTPDLDKTFNRGYTDLFLAGTKGDWNSGDAAKGMGEYIGTIQDIRPAGTSLLKVKVRPAGQNTAALSLHSGDGLCFVEKNGRTIGSRAETATGLEFTCKKVDGMAAGMKLWRNRDNEFEKQLEKNQPRRMIPVRATFSCMDGYLNICAQVVQGSSSPDCTKDFPGTIATSISLPLSDYPMAENQARMKEMLAGQFSKASDIFSFSADTSAIMQDSPLPLLGAAQLNGIRRELAQDLAEKILHAGIQTKASTGTTTAAKGIPQLPERSTLVHKRIPEELMRTKYCVLHQWGMCPKQTGEASDFAKNGLFIMNNGKKLRLVFDCRNCEMVVKLS